MIVEDLILEDGIYVPHALLSTTIHPCPVNNIFINGLCMPTNNSLSMKSQPTILKVTNVTTEEVGYYYFNNGRNAVHGPDNMVWITKLATPTQPANVLHDKDDEYRVCIGDHAILRSYERVPIKDIELYRLIPHMSYYLFNQIFKNHTPIFAGWKHYRDAKSKYKLNSKPPNPLRS